MKMIALLMALVFSARAHAVSNSNSVELSAKRASSAFTYDMDVSAFSIFSVQIDLADAHAATKTFVGSQAIDIDNDTIALTAHNLPVGLGVVLSTGANYNAGGLAYGTTYYVIPSGDNAIQLATSLNNAVAGTAVDIAAVPAVDSATITLTPQQFASSTTDGIVYQGSNDGSTFYSLSQSSVPYDSSSTGALTTFVDYPSRYVRLKFTAPTTGAMSVTATLNGRR